MLRTAWVFVAVVAVIATSTTIAACGGEHNKSQYEQWLADHPNGVGAGANPSTPTTSSDPNLPAQEGDASAKPPSQPSANACTSGAKWTDGDKGSSLMHPGKACLNCHATHQAAPDLDLAGTVFTKDHEPDDCNGVADVVTVEVSDLRGRQATFKTNSAGNFIGTTKLTPPFRNVKVIRGGKERVMKALVLDGDCNTCHSEAGRDGAVRLIAP